MQLIKYTDHLHLAARNADGTSLENIGVTYSHFYHPANKLARKTRGQLQLSV
jgi:hypothetical protein